MAITGNKQRNAVQLDWRDEDGYVTVTPSDESRFAIKIRRAVEILQVGANLDEFKAQFQVLLSVLAGWLKTRKDIADAYITTNDGTLAFLVVRNIATYDEEFEDSLSDLDMDIANDVDLDKVRIRAISLPSVSDEALASFLDPAFSLRYANAETFRSHSSSQQES